MKPGFHTLFLTGFFALILACGSPPTYPRSETLNALESRLTRPAAGVEEVEYYLHKVQSEDHLDRAESFFKTLAEVHPDQPLYRYGWGRSLRLKGQTIPARVRYLEALDLLDLKDEPQP